MAKEIVETLREGSITAAEAAETIEGPPIERTHFRALLASNPNYFGNLSSSPLPAQVPIVADTRFEEIGCVGFHPQLRRLDAVVFVKLPFGYGGDICSRGTREYVRFYLSYDNGASWVDLGDASVTVYNVPTDVTAGRQLEYAVSVPCAPEEKRCEYKNVVLVRAILSWDYEPPANQPNWRPVWGEVHNTHILVEPRRRVPWFELFADGPIKVPAAVSPLLDLDQVATLKTPDTLSLAQVHALYKDKGVEPQRYALPFIQKLLAQPSFGGEYGGLPPKGLFGELDIDPKVVMGPILNPKDGNTFYEELDCVGYNPVTSELAAVFRVKRPYGYSGGLCSAGSQEFVTFWADLNNDGSFETCLGTAEVKVYDLEQDVPGGGLEYSVSLPVNFFEHRQNCRNGPRVIPIRAILSWNVWAECPFPNRPPVWGNHDDTLILLPPGDPVKAGDFNPTIDTISGIVACDIDQHTGRTLVGDRPFGGAVYIVGTIPGAMGLPLGSLGRIKYRLWAEELPLVPGVIGRTQPIADALSLSIVERRGGTQRVMDNVPQTVDAAGYYTYQVCGLGTPEYRYIAGTHDLLGVWTTTPEMHLSRWRIFIEAVDTASGIHYRAELTHCPDGMSTVSDVVVHLDEQRPDVHVRITHVQNPGGDWVPAGNCDEFIVGARIRGTYSVFDHHFSRLSLRVEPEGPARGHQPSPADRSYAPLAMETLATGASGEWTLDTGGGPGLLPMDPCGYIVRLSASDRTIVSGNGGWSNSESVGFCLRAAPAA